jgi:hypothetical protein
MKEQVWEIAKDHDIVVVRGLKKGFQARKAIYVTHMWVIDPESDEDIEEELEVV